MATKAETQYQKVAEKLRDTEGAEIGQMFGMPTLKFNGKAFAGLFGGEMTFKLTGEAHAKALALKGAKLFDPMGSGRVMKEWVQVPVSESAKWETIALEALEYVRSIPAKPKAAKSKTAIQKKPSKKE